MASKELTVVDAANWDVAKAVAVEDATWRALVAYKEALASAGIDPEQGLLRQVYVELRAIWLDKNNLMLDAQRAAS